ncbi:OmpH family outer membrane protein [Arenibacter sp. GZD96]|uniref:OmpH family outer membrane protein n=1 Tax=Aurantibrevibacter litoralis TaxID=3106030 RepID=UPI002AFE3C93|nr:OmpH family outer membrane protein [Arenibacter sp. GZD-96]MEA1786466.1 OmpH family outer membrane protein [Arenibacter sp. GZD-96]
MKNIVLAFTIVLAVACKQEKIGYVDNVKLINAYQEKVDVETKFNAKAAKFTKKRDSISQSFQLEAQAFQQRAQSMAQNRAQEEYGLLQQRSQMIGQQLQQEEQQLQQENQTEIDSMVSKVKREISAYGKANGYAYILSGGDGGSVLYGAEAHNLTEEITKLLNEKYKK